jgi:dihydroorotate dehydrogenase (NAD+) catalytic subunit
MSPATPGMDATRLPDLSVTFAGVPLRHPLLNASGTWDVLAASRTMDRDNLRDFPFSAYVPKTVTPEARAGNLPPRVTETASGMINSIGLANPGLAAYLDGLPLLAALREPLFVSVGGSCPAGYLAVVRGVEDALAAAPAGTMPWVAGYELNISCPNVASGCLSIGTDATETAALVGAVRPLTARVLIVKLTPNVTSVVPVARAAAEAGADALSLINTLKALVLDPDTLQPFLGNRTGGLSGPAIKPVALRLVAEVAEAVPLPVIGMGGIVSGRDVLEFIACGATAVALGAAIFADPEAPERVVHELAQEMTARGYDRLDQVRGRALAEHPRPDCERS